MSNVVPLFPQNDVCATPAEVAAWLRQLADEVEEAGTANTLAVVVSPNDGMPYVRCCGPAGTTVAHVAGTLVAGLHSFIHP